jgi:hypothetical protein
MQTQSGSIYLTAGIHTITIPFYEDGGGGSGLEVSWDQRGGMEQLGYTVLSPPLASGLLFEAYNVGAGNLVQLTSDASYPTIEEDAYMDMTPNVIHPSVSQSIWYSNDPAFIDEIPDFD